MAVGFLLIFVRLLIPLIILLSKMEHYGVRDTALEWFKSYLSNRKQYVYSNGESQLKDITCGVPQGVSTWASAFLDIY